MAHSPRLTCDDPTLADAPTALLIRDVEPVDGLGEVRASPLSRQP
jgi:hypothetical protein